MTRPSRSATWATKRARGGGAVEGAEAVDALGQPGGPRLEALLVGEGDRAAVSVAGPFTGYVVEALGFVESQWIAVIAIQIQRVA